MNTIKEKIIKPSTVVNMAVDLFDSNHKVIRGASRRARVVAIRDLCFKVCKDHLFMSDREIAFAFGKERSSVTIGLKRVKDNLENREQYRLMLSALERSLGL